MNTSFHRPAHSLFIFFKNADEDIEANSSGPGLAILCINLLKLQPQKPMSIKHQIQLLLKKNSFFFKPWRLKTCFKVQPISMTTRGNKTKFTQRRSNKTKHLLKLKKDEKIFKKKNVFFIL